MGWSQALFIIEQIKTYLENFSNTLGTINGKIDNNYSVLKGRIDDIEVTLNDINAKIDFLISHQ